MPRTILISGGSRGIGRATATLAATLGWQVAITYRSDEAAAQETIAEIEGTGGKALAIQADTVSEPDTIRTFDATLDRFGTLDAVVVNAGIVAPPMPLAEMSLDRMRRVFDTNILGAFLFAREATRRIQGPGAIVLVSSVAAKLGSPGEYVDYAASKGAIDTLTLGLAKELAPAGIRVNAVRPGIIDTDIHASGGQPDRAERIGPTVPMARAGRADEVAEAILWLASDAASYTTGALLDVTGGR